MLLGLQSGYTKYPCCLCLWDSRADEHHYIQKDWPSRTNLLPGSNTFINTPLICPSKIILPPLHIKHGLMKKFTDKALDIGGHTILFLKSKFPYKSEAKLKAGIFDGPQIRELIRDRKFDIIINDT